MRIVSKFASLLMIAILVSAVWAVPTISAQTQPSEHGGGCHGNPAPHQTPAHDCCLTNHDVALPTFSNPRPPQVYCICRVDLAVPASTATAADHIRAQFLSFAYESPGATHLRI